MIEIFAQISFGLALIAVLLSLFNLLTLKAANPKDRKSTRLNSSHMSESRMPSSA